MPADAPSADAEGRSQLVAAALVGLVVLVLGFGSGIGAVFERDGAAPAPAGGTGGTGGVAVGAASSPAGGAGGSGAAPAGSTRPASSANVPGVGGARSGGSAAAPTTTHPPSAHRGPSTTTTRPPGAAPPSAVPPEADPPVAAGGCDVVAASAGPFVDHVEAAHLETSPGGQVADALATDDYVVAHTTLAGTVTAPIVGLLLGVPDATEPLWAHVQAAHLETSPGDQVADALATDDYVLAHTAVVEAVLAGPMADALGGGSC